MQFLSLEPPPFAPRFGDQFRARLAADSRRAQLEALRLRRFVQSAQGALDLKLLRTTTFILMISPAQARLAQLSRLYMANRHYKRDQVSRVSMRLSSCRRMDLSC